MIGLILCLSGLGDPALPGPFRVGVVTETAPNPPMPTPLTVECWYPAVADAPTSRLHPNGPPVVFPKAFPTVLFSHGFAAVRRQSAELCSHLASHGFVVLACDHPGSNFRDINAFGALESVLRRPLDLHNMANAFLQRSADPASRWYQRLDGRLSVMGHSLGGYTSLALGGAWVDVRGKKVPHPPDQPKPDFIDRSDSRVLAVVALAPVMKPFLSAESLQEMKKPTMILGGTLDWVTSPAENQRPIFDHLRGPKYLGIIAGASHLSFADEAFVRMIPRVATYFDRPSLPRSVIDPIIFERVTAFLDVHVAGRTPFATRLQQGTSHLEWTPRP